MEGENLCSICQDDMEVPYALNCKHSFCTECIMMWLKDHDTCPICRIAIIASSKEKYAQSCATTSTTNNFASFGLTIEPGLCSNCTIALIDLAADSPEGDLRSLYRDNIHNMPTCNEDGCLNYFPSHTAHTTRRRNSTPVPTPSSTPSYTPQRFPTPQLRPTTRPPEERPTFLIRTNPTFVNYQEDSEEGFESNDEEEEYFEDEGPFGFPPVSVISFSNIMQNRGWYNVQPGPFPPSTLSQIFPIENIPSFPMTSTGISAIGSTPSVSLPRKNSSKKTTRRIPKKIETKKPASSQPFKSQGRLRSWCSPTSPCRNCSQWNLYVSNRDMYKKPGACLGRPNKR